MGDENTPLNATTARHLLRRAGFGATADDVADFASMTRGEAADRLLAFTPSAFRPMAPQNNIDLAHNKWLRYMVRSRSPLQEKLVLFWHDHFATNFSTVQDVGFMASQNRTLRLNCKGNMRTLVKAINLDPAMMRFLDTDDNRKSIPNENYARELQELFTLGVNDFAGNPNYTQQDVAQIARAFTGWRFLDDNDNLDIHLNTNQHDFMANFPSRGPKVIYAGNAGVALRPGGGDFTQPDGEGEPEIDAVVDIIFSHTDTNGKNTVARRTTKRLMEYFAHPGVSTAAIDAIIADSGFDTTFEIAPLLRAMFSHDAFYPASGSVHNSVKWPIDYVVGTLRNLPMNLKSRDQYVNGGQYARALDRLRDMGQEVFGPPSVFGWDWELSWISSASMLSRYSFARDCIMARYGGGRSVFNPTRHLVDPTLTDPGDIVDRVTEVLGVAEQLSVAERQELIDYMGGGPIDLFDYDVRQEKLHGLFLLVLQSPAYQVH
jgi:uncharacterized protein (DUF1800 family)